ncbi:MAG: hypothetical protein ALECFALPRED_010479 [Alectoria fallacina]|uniref:Uncharacterized protein n=1 Tax=Alectoria fallacina TaxID=1903189 RepID=A0A8H3F4U8_9LECA|nr:MAG: hypothetical protein ALECFALPRED_010479 [Alectoria fallacina]
MSLDDTTSVIENGYQATVRRGSRMLGGLIEASGAQDSGTEDLCSSYTSQKVETTSVDRISISAENNEALILRPSRSSWVQSLTEIAYEDIISAHSVDTFVPLILIREFLSITSQRAASVHTSSMPRKPLAHIINVSPREGIFESSANSGEMTGLHVHTNTSKAGLNMMTETEAAACLKSRHVAMNMVDPGYRSAAPEMHDKDEGRIDFEDGTGRVLRPIAELQRGVMHPCGEGFLSTLEKWTLVRIEVGR